MSSEKIDREIAQLELALESLEVASAAADAKPESDEATDTAATEQRLPPRRRGKPRIAADAPRESIVLDPGERCPDCGGTLRLVGEDVAELKVLEIHRPKKSCRDCERMVQTPAPSRPIPRGLAGPSLLAHILVTKFDDHVPLYRQAEIFARMGADIVRSTLIDWCGQAAGAVRPIANLIRAEVIAGARQLRRPIGGPAVAAREVDVHKLPAMLTALRLPSFQAHWQNFAERADLPAQDGDGWSAAKFLDALAERETRRIQRHLAEAKRRVALTPRRTILPSDLFAKYTALSFWRDPGGSTVFRITVRRGPSTTTSPPAEGVSG